MGRPNTPSSKRRTNFETCICLRENKNLRRSDQQHQQQPSKQKQQQSSDRNKHYETSQISGVSVHANNVNINATDDPFLAFTMVQQNMTDFSGAATEKEKATVITKAVCRLLKNNAKNSS
jgi:hypothetical protein